MSGLMEGKRGLIMGLANDRSLAWGIAKKLAEQAAARAAIAATGAPAANVDPALSSGSTEGASGPPSAPQSAQGA